MDMKTNDDTQHTRCIRCALENGCDPFGNQNQRCIWRKMGKMCPDYDKRPDLDGAVYENIPDDETEILHRQMKLLAERSRLLKADRLIEVSKVMIELHKRLTEHKADSSGSSTENCTQ